MVSESNFHTTKFVAENLLPIEMEKTEILMNKYVYLGLSILKLSKILLHDCWYDYVKPNYGENSKPCYMDTFSFIIHVKTDDICKDIGEDIKTSFVSSNFELDRLLPKEKK